MGGGPPSGRLASTVLAAAALPFAAVLALAVGAARAGLTTDQIIVYGAVPVLWLAATAVALRSSVAVRQNVALALVAAGVGLAAAEVALGLWLRVSGTEAPVPPPVGEVLELREAGEDAFPRVPGNSLVDLGPVLRDGDRVWHPITPGPGHALILLCHESGPLVTYAADRFGFQNPDTLWDGPPPDVAIVGDSYTAGVCVDRGATIPARLRSSLRVLDLGVSGAGPLQELALLREYAAPLAPPTVLWIYYEGNDLWDLRREASRDWLVSYLDATHRQGLAEHREPVDARYRAWIDSLVATQSAADAGTSRGDWKSRIGGALRLQAVRRVAGFGVPFPSREPPLGLLPEVLTRARDDVAGWGGRLVLAYMPAYARYAALVGEGVEGRRALLALAEENGIPVIDLHEAFLAHDDPRSLWTSPARHLTPEGYAVAATAIRAGLAKDAVR